MKQEKFKALVDSLGKTSIACAVFAGALYISGVVLTLGRDINTNRARKAPKQKNV